jgi:hypothetical protein
MWKKKNSDENLQATIHNKDYDRSKQQEFIEYSNYLGSMITNDERCVLKLNPGLPRQKQRSTRLFTSNWTYI